MKTRTLIWILAIWILSIGIMMLVSGCRTKSVTEYVAVHDTLHISKTDTLYKVKTEVSHDTLRIEVEKIVTVNEGGDTVKVEIYKDRWRDRWNVKTDTVVKHTTDTIYRVAESNHDKVITRGATWWERWRWCIAAICVLSMGAWCWWRWRSKP